MSRAFFTMMPAYKGQYTLEGNLAPPLGAIAVTKSFCTSLCSRHCYKPVSCEFHLVLVRASSIRPSHFTDERKVQATKEFAQGSKLLDGRVGFKLMTLKRVFLATNATLLSALHSHETT